MILNHCIYTIEEEGKNKPIKVVAEYNKVSIPEMVTIIDSYRYKTQDNEAYPSKVYIEAKKGDMQYVEPSEILRQGWEKFYSKPLVFETSEEMLQAKNKAEQFFPSHVVIYQDYGGKHILKVHQPVEKLDIKHRKDFADWQEYNDYLMVYGDAIPVSQRDKEERIVGPQPFRFKDGTEVTAPFKPNSQQEKALNEMSDFIKSDKTSMTLAGYAGTGKTSVMEILAQKLKKERIPILFSASTNKAAAVLKSRVGKAGFTATTLNKVFGIRVEVDESESYDASNLKNKPKDPNELKIMPGTVVVIDEASMINEENYKLLNHVAEVKGLKIIYIGDRGQLAPVKETQISKVFRDNNGKVISLTKVERTEDNAILEEATNIRNGKSLSGESSFNKEGKGVAYIKPGNQQEISSIIERFVPELRKNPDYFRILALHNNVVAEYNQKVRKALGYEDGTPRVGEPIVGYANWGSWYNRSTGQTEYQFINSESYKVTEAKKPTEISYKHGKKIYKLTAVPLTIEDALGNRQDINFIDIKGNEANRQVASELAKEKARLYNEGRIAPKGKKGAYYEAAAEIEKFLFVNDHIVDPEVNRKGKHDVWQSKVFDFGYAMTVHKSQGSTFTHVLIDDTDIATAIDNRRPSIADIIDSLSYDIETGKPIDVDKDISSFDVKEGGNILSVRQSMPVTASTINRAENDVVSLRQQLEYVAVSRATDTATIISNNVQKEDSPLNHIAKVKKTMIKKGDTRLPQLVEHLNKIAKAYGVSVFGKDAMEKLFKEHPEIISSLQRAIGRFINKYSLPKGELPVLSSALITKLGNKVEYDYVINTSNYQYVVDYRGEGEFDIIDYYPIDIKIKDEVNDSERKGGLGSYDRLSLRDETTKREHNSDSYNVTEQGASRDNAGLDIQARKGETQQAQSDDSSAKYQGRSTRLIKTGADGTNFPRVIEVEDTLFFITPDGEVYGFVDKEGNIYLDETVITPEHPIHEYTHLWDRVLAKKNPKLWSKGIELMKDPNLKLIGHNKTVWQETEEDENYGGRWQKIKESNPSKYESLIASEVHAKLTGKKGLKMLDEISKQKGSESIIDKLKEWMLDVWKELKATFSDWSEEEIQKLTIQDFVQMTVRDFADAVNFATAKDFSQKSTTENQNPAYYEGLITPDTNTIFVFGSNPEGRHGVGAAKTAKDKFGAIYGQGEGLQGNAYALPTKDLRVKENKGLRSIPSEQITESIRKMYQVATEHPDKQFKIAYTHNLNETSLNGYTGAEMIKMFKEAGPIPSNVIFSKNWVDHWSEVQSSIIKKEEATQQSFVPHPIQMNNLGKETGQKLIQATFAEEESRLLELDKRLGESASEEEKRRIIAEIDDVVNEREGTRVTLPNYQKEEENPEVPILVDQEWKIPILQDLDSQITDEMSPEEQAPILEKMENLLKALSKEEYEAAPTKKEGEVNQKMADYKRLNQQRRNLINNTIGLAPSEIRQTAEQIVDSISDVITEIQRNPEKVKEYFPTVSTKIDFSKADRKSIVKAIGINALIDYAKYQFDKLRYDESNPDAYAMYNNRNLIKQARLITDNWEAMLRFASDVFVANEGFGIKRNARKGNFEANEKEYTGYDYDNFVDPQDEEEIREQHDEQEYWQLVVRTIDALNSMSELVRQALHECYLTDSQGKKVLSKFGIPLRVDKKKAVNQILRWTQGALDINQMIERLEERRPQNPWLNQLIQRLKDQSGKETDFQSQFYGVMHRHFQLYSIGKLDKGKYVSKVLNNNKALSDVMDGLNAQFKMHSLPLFTAKGLNRENFKKFQGYKKALEELMAPYNFTKVDDVVTIDRDIDDADMDRIAQTIKDISSIIGQEIPLESIRQVLTPQVVHSLSEQVRFIDTNISKQDKIGFDGYNPFDFHQTNGIRNAVRKFLTPLIEELSDSMPNTVFEDGKMYQSYVIPSFLTQLFDHFAQKKENLFSWIDSFYGSSEWFKKDGRYRVPLLQLLTNQDWQGDRTREAFDHVVQLTFNKHSYMRNLSAEEYPLSIFTAFFSEKVNEKTLEYSPAWVRVPIQSNKPSNEFIKVPVDRSEDYKKNIIEGIYGVHGGLFDMYLMELDRIDTVRKRDPEERSSTISSFDKNGKYFQVLTFLNSYLLENNKPVDSTWSNLLRREDGTIDTEANEDLQTLLNKKLNATEPLSTKQEGDLMGLVKRATKAFMEQYTKTILDNWDKDGLIKAAEKIEGIRGLNRSVRESLENFIWNDFFAANNILMLTITDKAFYDGSDSLQKRLAELHAPGMRGNKYATDYEGKRVSDGYYRTVVLKDFEAFRSNIIDNISAVFDKMIKNAPENEKAGYEALKDTLVRKPKTNGAKDKGGRYWQINATDAQAYSSASSYRKKAFIFGKWSQAAEEVYNRLRKGDYNLHDLETTFQPMKPFVYGHVQKSMDVVNAPIQSMLVPFQAKNAEYLLIMADALTRNENTGRPNLLKVISDIMEESERRFPGKGIDTIQFESAIKSGNHGMLDIGQYLLDENGEKLAYAELSRIFHDGKNEDGTEYDYDTFVQKTDYDNYALQQEVPKHFQEHEQAEPSQMRMNIPTDLDYYDYAGQINQYKWTDHKGNEHSMDSKQIKKEWENVHAANIEEDLNSLFEALKLNPNKYTKKERNIALSEILLDEIESSPRYGVDLMLACEVDDITGEFMIPKGDPIQSKRIEQLINSIIKSRVNKQKIAGGPVVQVSNFGTSRQLHIRFNDKNGGLLMTREEYEQSLQNKPQSQTDKFNAKYGKREATAELSYEEYVKQNQAGIAHFEVFAPASMKKIFQHFMNPDGSINFEAVKRTNPDLLKMITGRIPNEDKYSIAHAMIVGFLPEVAGEAIMFPYELTEIDDSDFDVDKRYCQRKVIYINEKDRKDVEPVLVEKGHELYKKQFKTTAASGYIERMVSDLLDYPKKFKTDSPFRKALWDEYLATASTTVYPEEGKDARNNQIIDMSWAIMSNEMTAPKILNPGGFEAPKKNAYVIAAYRANDGRISFEELEGIDVKELKALTGSSKDLAWIDTQIQYYKQNTAGSNLIGVFAVNKVAHATLEGDGLMIDIAHFCGEHPFKIADTVFGGKRDRQGRPVMTEEEFNKVQEEQGKTGIYAKTTYDEYLELNEDPDQENLMVLDATKDLLGSYVGKTIGQGIGASADTAKDPWLDLIDVNMTTAGTFNSMLRLGMPWNDVALFMSQEAIIKSIKEFNRKVLEGEKVSFDSIVDDRITRLKTEAHFADESEINKQPLTREELNKGLLDSENMPESDKEDRKSIDYKVLIAFSKMRSLSKAIKDGPTTITRLNSMSAAVGPLIIDNIILDHKLRQFLSINNEKGTGFKVMTDRGIEDADTDTILEMHPILKQFSRTFYSRTEESPSDLMFRDMPAGSIHFRKEILQKLPDHIKSRIYDDRALLSKLSDFYQSYMLVANNIISPEDIGNLINDFPNEFMGKGIAEDGTKRKAIKAQYPDNAFIQSIQLDVNKKTDRPFLKIDTTGMMEQEKERLRMAWVDLHKTNPELSKKLFAYAFFRGGIGFSPRTWMSLVPTFVKEGLETEINGVRTTYIDTFRRFPTAKMPTDVLIQQFVRNNWNDNTLAPIKGGEGTQYDINLAEGECFIRDPKDISALSGVAYMRTLEKDETVLWELVGTEIQNVKGRKYRRIMPLGNNGEYVEMSTSRDLKPLEKTTSASDQTEVEQMPATTPQDDAASQTSTPITVQESQSQEIKNLSQFADLFQKVYGMTRNDALKTVAMYKNLANEGKLSSTRKKMIGDVYKAAGVTTDQEKAVEFFKELC